MIREYCSKNTGKSLTIGNKTAVMGILNCTPDSFSDGGKYDSAESAVSFALQMIENGADIIDIGGESTRPGSAFVSQEVEFERVIPVIKKLRQKTDCFISIDTTKAGVAKAAIGAGADIINDISAFTFDSEMCKVAAESGVPVIIMHIKGVPEDMQEAPEYDNVVEDIKHFFTERIEFLSENNIEQRNIIIDPGLGFGKTETHNLEILKNLKEFLPLDLPILIGASRKSFIGSVLDLGIDERLEGTSAVNSVAILNGARIIRVHDVLQMRRVSNMVDAIVSV